VLQITVPKEGVTVLFCPSGVRAPQRGSAMGRDGRPVAVSDSCKKPFTRNAATMSA
jgi:hypothetical protein